MKNEEIIKIIKKGGIGFLPTDTIYGLVGSAFSQEAVERIYHTKNRDPKKPFIVLISSLKDLEKFGHSLTAEEKAWLSKVWPGKVSIILSLPASHQKEFKYLHRGTKALAFRLPKKKALLEILKKTGPLVAPSANPEGAPPFEGLREAKDYFGSQLDFYVSAGKRLGGAPSTLVKLDQGQISIIRQGAVKIAKN